MMEDAFGRGAAKAAIQIVEIPGRRQKTQYSQGFCREVAGEIVPQNPSASGTFAAILCICEHVRRFENFAASFHDGGMRRYVTPAESFDFSGETMGLTGAEADCRIDQRVKFRPLPTFGALKLGSDCNRLCRSWPAPGPFPPRSEPCP